MKKINLLVAIAFIAIFNFSYSQVGIGTTSPVSLLDIQNTGNTNSTLNVNSTSTTNVNPTQLLTNYGRNSGLVVANLNTSNGAPGIYLLQNGTTSGAHGFRIEHNNPTLGTYGMGVFNNGQSHGYVNLNTGTGVGLYNLNVGGGAGVYTNLTAAGGGGYIVDIADNNGVGLRVSAVDDPDAPTSGGDVYALSSKIMTTTPTDPADLIIYGSIVGGEQFGVGWGAILNHFGTAGNCAEFNMLNEDNDDLAVSITSSGKGSAIKAYNDSDSLDSVLLVGDFAYSGSDSDDHVAVSGISNPDIGKGIGVRGIGNFYGVYSQGDSGASGIKTFLIDHPEDPANKFLRHYSVESNEVVNMYRGKQEFDANGKAVIQLPDYYDSININPSYQLTPIGAAMPNLYIEQEVSQGVFVVAGGVPGKKVSWTLTAERNDPYLQQNPQLRQAVFEKEGPRKGRYVTPELYGQPKTKSMFGYDTKPKVGKIADSKERYSLPDMSETEKLIEENIKKNKGK